MKDGGVMGVHLAVEYLRGEPAQLTTLVIEDKPRLIIG
jgi:hypothetical protein